MAPRHHELQLLDSSRAIPPLRRSVVRLIWTSDTHEPVGSVTEPRGFPVAVSEPDHSPV
jgi:hypothetical protein